MNQRVRPEQGKSGRVPARLYALLAVLIGLQVAFWGQTHSVRLPVAGVDPAPSDAVARVIGLGDPQFYYRAGGLWLQNMGDEGGDVTPLRQLDYDRLGQWFGLLHAMDTRAEFVPVLAGYYYALSPDPEQVRKVAMFLRQVALIEPQRQWRWLAQAVYLARHRVKDMTWALALAQELAALPVQDLPIWTRQMSAFILADVGDREAARDILEALMASDPNLDPAELNFMRHYIEMNLKRD